MSTDLLRRQYDELAADNGRLQNQLERLSKRIQPLLLIESYAVDVVNAWVRLGRCEDEFGHDDEACNEKREGLDADILCLQRALVESRTDR